MADDGRLGELALTRRAGPLPGRGRGRRAEDPLEDGHLHRRRLPRRADLRGGRPRRRGHPNLPRGTRPASPAGSASPRSAPTCSSGTRPRSAVERPRLDQPGFVRFRKRGGEYHANNPDPVIKALHASIGLVVVDAADDDEDGDDTPGPAAGPQRGQARFADVPAAPHRGPGSGDLPRPRDARRQRHAAAPRPGPRRRAGRATGRAPAQRRRAPGTRRPVRPVPRSRALPAGDRAARPARARPGRPAGPDRRGRAGRGDHPAVLDRGDVPRCRSRPRRTRRSPSR